MSKLEEAISKLDTQQEGGLLEMLANSIQKKIEENLMEKLDDYMMKNLGVLRGPKGESGKSANSPIKGIDYLTPQEMEQTRTELTPQKGVHYFDGSDGRDGVGTQGPKGDRGIPGLSGRDGKPGKNGGEIAAEEVRNKLQSLSGEARLDASAIKNLPTQKFGGKGVMRGGGASVEGPEVPSGTINGVNTTFTLSFTPKANSVMFFVNGAFQREGSGQDFTISGRTITTASAPPNGSNLLAVYRK